jgi:hypothetical protein
VSDPTPARRSAVALIQRHLDALYRPDLHSQVEHFLITEDARDAMVRAGAIEARRGAREEVYVLEEGGGLALAVFIDQGARSAVEGLGEDGTLRLDPRRFGDFCVALEGVSHFVLLAHRAAGETPVTQLELELQAEVDKYLAARLLAWRQDSGPLPEAIRRQLFSRFTLDARLDDEQRDRYRTANQLALRYCDFLERSFLRERRMLSLLRELRDFFRSAQAQRLARIAGA